MKKQLIVSIYSGAGGIDIGFKNAGFTNVFATDNWEPACKTLELNNMSENIVCDDIRSIKFSEIKNKYKDTACLVGGPPCPAYSKSRFYLKNKKRAMEDENAFTLKEYFRAVKEIDPKVFFFENVFGFVYKPHRDAFDFLETQSRNLGYEISYKVINCANYGVPQTRERFFCIGVKRGNKPFVFPKESHSEPLKGGADLKRWVTCGDVLSDLDTDLPEDINMQAGSKHSDLLKIIPPGENYLFLTKEKGYHEPYFKWRSRYWSFLLKLSKERPSWTIQASNSNNMGPFHWKNRFLRINEIKRIQTFPDEYKLYGDYKTNWRLIGNAVPPLMSEILANEIKKQYFSSDK